MNRILIVTDLRVNSERPVVKKLTILTVFWRTKNILEKLCIIENFQDRNLDRKSSLLNNLNFAQNFVEILNFVEKF